MTIKHLKQAWPAFVLPLLFALTFIFIIPAVQAQGPEVAAAPVAKVSASPMDVARAPVEEIRDEEATHPMIRLTPEKSQIVRLEERAQSLIVGNPTHLNVLLDNSRTLVLVPREPGATHFTVLGENGKVIMQRHVIIGSGNNKYVRIRRSCMNAGGGECEETSVYYCPDMCHRVSIMSADQGQPTQSPAGEQ